MFMFSLVTACVQHEQTSLQVNLNSASLDFYTVQVRAQVRAQVRTTSRQNMEQQPAWLVKLTSAEGHNGLLTSTINTAVYLRLFA